MKLSNIIPKPSNRAAIVGTTGSGKTYLVRQMLNFRQHIVVLDTKGFINWDGYTLFKGTSKAGSDAKIFKKMTDCTDEKIIFRPSAKWLRDDEQIEIFFQWLYWRGNTTVYIDELTSIADTYRMPKGLQDLLARGREKGLEVWVSTQRPSGIPQQVLTESEHCYCFKVRHPADRKKLFEMYGFDQEMLVNLPKRYFHFYEDGEEISEPKILS